MTFETTWGSGSPFIELDTASFKSGSGRSDSAAFKSIPLSAATAETLFGSPDPGIITPTMIYQTVSWVYRCVQYRAMAVAGIPWTLEGTPVGVDVEMLKSVLPTLLRNIEASLCLDAAAYVFPERNLVRLLDLRWVACKTIKPKFDSAGLVGFDRVFGGGGQQNTMHLAPDELVYIWLPDPLVEIGPGISPAQVALKAAGIVGSSNEFVTQFFSRGGMNATLLIVDAATNDPDLKRLEAWWKRLMAGVRNAWQTTALRRNVDVKQLGYQPDQLAMPQLKAAAMSEICAAFGLSEDIIASNAANFATATAHGLTTHQHTIMPEAKLISSALNDQLFRALGLELVWHPEQMEILQQVNALQSKSIVELYTAGIISREEARAQTGFSQPDANVVAGSEGNETSVEDGTAVDNADTDEQPTNPAAQAPAVPTATASFKGATLDDLIAELSATRREVARALDTLEAA